MLSKQAFNALLKTLEEPPEYLKFIFATTEIKKIPITVVSRCQRYDLPRIKSTELFDFIKKIKDKENGKVNDEAIKLIVKFSEGSVRDALSLLDRALLSLEKGKELDLNTAQKIFGYFDKSQLIDLFNLILKGKENEVMNIYRKIYDQGVDPKVFINDFLELLYYLKNINSLTIESTNFSLNNQEFDRIKEISNKLDVEILILFWQFTIKTLDELEIVSNQHLSIEMFLMRLIYLSGFKSENSFKKEILPNNIDNSNNKDEISPNLINENTVDQIKNITQKKTIKPNHQSDIEEVKKTKINSLNDLLNICNIKKEMKLKYELENNVNLVKFEQGRVEISFNDNLDKNFVKDLSSKLFDWTDKRWIISFSKNKGEMTIKQQEITRKNELIEESKKTDIYKKMKSYFADAELIDIEPIKKNKIDE